MKTGDLKSQLSGIIGQAKKFLAPIIRHHVIIAVVVICGMLMYTVIAVNQILSSPPDQDYLAEQTKESIKTNFDEETISRIEKLRDREQNPSLSLPSGRISPFIE